MNHPYVSVILTVYNAKRFISDSLGGIKKQTLKNIEIILIDDCSNDGTSDIVLNLIKDDKRIKYIRNDVNCGVAYSRNLGLKLAIGEYIIFLDDDDIFDKYMLEKSYVEAKRKNSDIHVFRSSEVLDNDTYYPMEWSINKDCLPEKDTFSCYDVQGNVFDIFVWWCWDKLFKRSKVIENGIKFQEIRTTNDLFFCCANFLLADKISVSDDILIYHNMMREGSLSNTRHLSYDCCVEAVKNLQDFMISQGLYEYFKSDFFNYLIIFFNWQLETIDSKYFELLKNKIKSFFLENNLDQFNFDSDDKVIKYNSIIFGSIEDYQNIVYLDYKNNITEMKKIISKKENYLLLRDKKIKFLKEKMRSLSEVNVNLIEDNSRLRHCLKNISNSRTWRATYPVRYVGDAIKKIIK